MIYNAARETATPRARGECPLCGATLIAKCGQLVTWHWAHQADAECDPWTEPESEWHRGFKALFERAGYRIEVVIGPHRADVVSPAGHIIELQYDYQSADKIAAREEFYGPDMAWIYRCHWDARLSPARHAGFHWQHPAPSMLVHQRPLIWELGTDLIRVRLEKDRWGDVRGQYGATVHRVDAPLKWTELLDDPLDPLDPPFMLTTTRRRIDELQKIRLAEVAAGRWPRASLEMWDEVMQQPYKWHEVTVRHAKEIHAAAQIAHARREFR